MPIHIIHTKRTVGKPNTFYVGRPTVLGNPFTHYNASTLADVKVGTHEEAVLSYQDYLDEELENGNEQIIEALEKIAQACMDHEHVYLACWCKDEVNPFQTDHELCHADVIRNLILDELEAED